MHIFVDCRSKIVLNETQDKLHTILTKVRTIRVIMDVHACMYMCVHLLDIPRENNMKKLVILSAYAILDIACLVHALGDIERIHLQYSDRTHIDKYTHIISSA